MHGMPNKINLGTVNIYAENAAQALELAKEQMESGAVSSRPELCKTVPTKLA